MSTSCQIPFGDQGLPGRRPLLKSRRVGFARSFFVDSGAWRQNCERAGLRRESGGEGRPMGRRRGGAGGRAGGRAGRHSEPSQEVVDKVEGEQGRHGVPSRHLVHVPLNVPGVPSGARDKLNPECEEAQSTGPHQKRTRGREVGGGESERDREGEERRERRGGREREKEREKQKKNRSATPVLPPGATASEWRQTHG